VRAPAFWIVVATLFLVGVAGLAGAGASLPLLLVFEPTILLATTICEFASCVLIAVIVKKFRERALLPLGVMFLACFLLDVSTFLMVRLPDLDQSLILGGNVAVPWFLNAWHIVVPACSIAYALMRRSERRLTRGATERFLIVGLPAAAVLTITAIAVLYLASNAFPPLISGEFFPASVHAVFNTANLAASVVALAVCAIVFGRRTRNDVDYAVILTLVASAVGVSFGYVALTRYDTAWTMAHVAYMFGSTFVLVAAIRELIGRSSESLRIESDQLRSEALAFERNAAVEASLVKSRFVATVSHELRTPLGGIIGMAELLERTALTDRQQQFTGAIRTSANSLFRIVNDLLDFSRAESGRLEIEARPYNLHQAVHDVVTLFRPQAERNGIALSAFVDPSLPRTIVGDETRVKQVLQNLLNNALRFTPQGSVSVEVVGGTTSGDVPVLCFSVRDTGIGIAPQAQAHIFEPFVQAGASTARRFGGTGLGLSIARHLVEMMSGQISVSSAVGRGSSFTFTIPYQPVLGDGDGRPSLSGVAVLVVEEAPELCALFVRYLEGWNMRQVLVADVNEARATIRDCAERGERFDVLIVGPTTPTAAATDFAKSLRDGMRFAPASAILVRDGAEAGAFHYPGFDALASTPLRQSELFDTLVRLHRQGFTERVLPTIAGVPMRAPRTERILVAEDNDVNQALLVAQLEHLGFSPDVVGDGKAAIEAVTANAYDLIFLDCQMPEVDGFETARRIRATWRRKRMPIIAVTANVLPGYRELCLAAGMNDYLAKPALIGPLAAVVDRWLPRTEDAAEGLEPAPSPGVANDANWVAATQERLREIFHGDESRVARVIGMSLAALRDGVETLAGEIAARDVKAERTAHRLKGVALEIGLFGLAVSAGALQDAIRDAAWEKADEIVATFREAVEATAKAVEAATFVEEGRS
jgi:signal transduction histidine kinase/DNA-binding response OmpR family regulator